PYAVYLPKRLEADIEAWLGGGKRLLVSSGPFGLYDALARESGGLWRKLFPDAQVAFAEPAGGGWSWPDADSESTLLRTTSGASECMALLRPLGATERDLAPTLLEAVGAATERVALSEEDRFELVVRDAADGVRYVLALNPDVDATREDVVSIQGAYAAAEDIDIPGAFPLTLTRRGGRTAFRLRLAPCEMAAIRLRPAPSR
ncbi:MAG: hypothetical protein ACODAJ_14050, partial [Planctomycetota bacterium]